MENGKKGKKLNKEKKRAKSRELKKEEEGRSRPAETRLYLLF